MSNKFVGAHCSASGGVFEMKDILGVFDKLILAVPGLSQGMFISPTALKSSGPLARAIPNTKTGKIKLETNVKQINYPS